MAKGDIARRDVSVKSKQFDLILNCLPAFVVATDEELRFTFVRGSALQKLGIGEAEIASLIGKPAESYFSGPNAEEILSYSRRALAGETSSYESEWQGRWYLCCVAPLRGQNDEIVGTVGVGIDITPRRRLADQLEGERVALSEAQELAELGSWRMDLQSGEVTMSAQLARLLGIEKPEEPLRFGELLRRLHPDEIRMFEAERDRVLRSCGPYDFSHRIVRPDGAVRHVRSRGHVECDENGKPVRCMGTMLDVTALTQAQHIAEVLAYHDSLTGLPNRWLLQDRLEQTIALARRDKSRFFVLFIDLDDFKRINDSLGHAEGDVLLAEVAQRLRKAMRETDTIARMGGDEFVVLLTEVLTDDQAVAAIGKLQSVFKAPFRLRGNDYVITASIGVAAYPDDAVTEGELLQYADTAMYDAKQSGRNVACRYHGASEAAASRRLQLEVEFPRALRDGEFRVHYQPVIDTRTMQVSGVEALLRWQHPTRGLLLPEAFIDVMEESEYIITLGEWVVREACAQVARWQKQFGKNLRLSVNVSPRQILRGKNVPAMLSAALRRANMDASTLELEITETTLVRDLEWATALLTELRELGIGIAIDDFGTGYNSLSYLKHFPVTALKIDRSFVGELGIDSFDQAVSFAVAALGRALHIRVVAEGVETRQQLQTLFALGCDEVQGNYFAPAVDAAFLTQRMASGFPDGAAN